MIPATITGRTGDQVPTPNTHLFRSAHHSEAVDKQCLGLDRTTTPELKLHISLLQFTVTGEAVPKYIYRNKP